jgi:ribonuclease Z
MMCMEPPTIYLPVDSVEAVQLFLRAVQKLDRGRLPVNLVGLKPDDEVELSRELVVKAFATRHTVPSLGYLVWERRKKLKPEYRELTGEQIRDLRLSGVEVSAEIRIPKVAYMGDTSPPGLDGFPEIYRSQILILELTFVAPNERPALIHKFGHTHLDDLIARAERFENEVIIASHFSTRLHPDQIQRIIDRRLPDSLRSRLKIWL